MPTVFFYRRSLSIRRYACFAIKLLSNEKHNEVVMFNLTTSQRLFAFPKIHLMRQFRDIGSFLLELKKEVFLFRHHSRRMLISIALNPIVKSLKLSGHIINNRPQR